MIAKDSFVPVPVDMTDTLISFKEPKLAPDERLYVDAYFLTFSHAKAHEAVNPSLKSYVNKNKYSKNKDIQYHINKKVLKKAQAISLDSDTVMDLLLQEATRLGKGSSPTARVQALTLLGKQLGLFEEKPIEKEVVTFNIINYDQKGIVDIEAKKELPEPIEEAEALNIDIESFK